MGWYGMVWYGMVRPLNRLLLAPYHHRIVGPKQTIPYHKILGPPKQIIPPKQTIPYLKIIGLGLGLAPYHHRIVGP
jgi:hypothetical protein